jgi:MFS family permease
VTRGAGGNGIGAELGRLIGGQVCLHASMSGLRMAAPLLALSQGHGKAAAGVLVALFALTQVFLALPAGRLADRRGLKLPVALSIAGATAGTAMAAIWPVYPVLCLSALLTGGSVGAATIALQRHVGRAAATPLERKQVFSWLSLAPAASNFLGPFASGLVIDHFGYRAAFLLLAVLAVSSWLWTRTARELPPEPAHAGPPGRAWDLLREPLFRRLMLMNWFFSAAWDVNGFMVPVLGHDRGLPASVIGTILGTFAIAAALVRLAMPAIAARLREWVLITAATALTGLFFVLYPFMHSALAMGLCSAALGMSLGAVQPMIMSMLHQITPSHRHGQAVAMRILIINASSLTMPMLFGLAGGVAGTSGVFWAMGLIIGLGSRLGFGLRAAEDEPQDH